jgi:hypothetical protein
MPAPSHAIQLTPEQVNDLSQKLSNMRHDINGHLSLVLAALELIRHKPQVADRMLATLAEQPGKITASMAEFSAQFETAFGIKRS